jgi:hypothetical protein
MKLGLWSLAVFLVQLTLMALYHLLIPSSASMVWNLIVYILMWVVSLRGYYFAIIRSRGGTPPPKEWQRIVLGITAATIGVVLLCCSITILELLGFPLQND